MDPLTIAGAFIIGGSIVSGIGQARAGRDQQEIFDARADLKLQETEFEEARLRRQIRTIIGQQIVGFAKGGVVGSQGSAADVRRDTAITGEITALLVRHFGQREADILRLGGEAAADAGLFSGIGTLLSGAGRAIPLFV